MFKFLEKLLGFPDSDEIAKLIEDGAEIIDVRTPSEFKSGHMQGSINIPLDSIDRQIKKLRASNSTIITCCRSGQRSKMAASMLKNRGIEAYNGGSWGNVQKIARQLINS
jgi:rhodanese-related sulfurtransferase